MTELFNHLGVIVVDVQGDFTELEKGSLSVPGSDAAYVEAVANETLCLKDMGLPIYATQDFHPSDHISFHSNHSGKKPYDMIRVNGRDQILWPPHCVQDSPGAGLLLDSTLFRAVIRKGEDPQYDSYSGFRDDGGRETVLHSTLQVDGIKKVVIYGLATDFCVRATALDAAAAGYRVALILSLCRGVAQESTRKAVEEMDGRGILVLENIAGFTKSTFFSKMHP